MTPRRALLLAALPLLSHPVLAQPSTTLEGVMAALATRRESRADFTESKEFPELSTPLPSTGTLSWTAPDRLEKRTTYPMEEILRVEGDRLLFSRPAQGIRREMSLEESPELRPLVESIRSTLAGDLATLRQHYEVGFQPQGEGWVMRLVPRSLRVRAALQSVEVSGRGADILSVVTRGNEGETRMAITPRP